MFVSCVYLLLNTIVYGTLDLSIYSIVLGTTILAAILNNQYFLNMKQEFVNTLDLKETRESMAQIFESLPEGVIIIFNTKNNT